MADLETEPGEKTVFTHTQADIDSAVKARLARESNAHTAALSEKDAAITELNANIEALKAETVKGQATNQTATEHSLALEKRLEQVEAERAEDKRLLAEQEQQKIVNSINAADKDALLKAGVDPKFAEMALNELHKSRTLEDGKAFYKDGEGAILEQSAVVDSLKAQYPEFITINRAGGNNTPVGAPGSPVDGSKETIEQFKARRESEGYYKDK